MTPCRGKVPAVRSRPLGLGAIASAPQRVHPFLANASKQHLVGRWIMWVQLKLVVGEVLDDKLPRFCRPRRSSCEGFANDCNAALLFPEGKEGGVDADRPSRSVAEATGIVAL